MSNNMCIPLGDSNPMKAHGSHWETPSSKFSYGSLWETVSYGNLRETQRLIDYVFPNHGFENGIINRLSNGTNLFIEIIILIINHIDQ